MAKAGKKKTAKGASVRGPWVGVALYGLDADTERGAAVRGVLESCGVAARTIPLERLSSQAGAIAGMPGYKLSRVPFSGQAPKCEFMLMCNLSRDAFDAVLAALKDAGLEVGCKAMLTKFNQRWPVATLIAEVSREHAAMQGSSAAEDEKDADE